MKKIYFMLLNITIYYHKFKLRDYNLVNEDNTLLIVLAFFSTD